MTDLRDLKFGVEIETIGKTRETAAKAIQSVVGGEVSHVASPSSYDPWEVKDAHSRIWKVVADASLTSVASNLRAEVVSPVLSYEDLPVLQEVVRALRKCGLRVDQNCGMHIHADSSAFTGKTLANLAKIMFKQEPLILTALGVSERRLHQYTKPISAEFIAKLEHSRPRTLEQVNRLWYGHLNTCPTHYDNTRYNCLNLHNVWYRGTVEFRMFEATLHAGKVKAAVQFVLAIAAKALNSRAASSRKREFDPNSAKYDFRIFLIHLGLNGDEFKTARMHLLHAMPGDAAFKRGRPKPKNQPGESREPAEV
ncbi:amidoligase family protein [bacterium]|nr:amidoligase family protein [bacterium]